MHGSISSRWWIAAALAALVSPGLSWAKAPGKPGPGEKVTKTGKLKVIRTVAGPSPQLADESSSTRYLLQGKLKRELLRLNGHRVRASGRVAKSRVGAATLRVSEYEILDAGGGQKPLVGMLRKRGAQLELVHKDGRVRVKAKQAFERRLRKKLNCKLWIVGDYDADTNTLSATRFGWLSCKKASAIKAPRKETRR